MRNYKKIEELKKQGDRLMVRHQDLAELLDEVAADREEVILAAMVLLESQMEVIKQQIIDLYNEADDGDVAYINERGSITTSRGSQS